MPVEFDQDPKIQAYAHPERLELRKDELDGLGSVAFDVLANDLDGNCDTVVIEECRPLSKTKRYRLVRIVERPSLPAGAVKPVQVQAAATADAMGGEADGPEEFHLVIVDGGRGALRGTEFEEALDCIRCGACLYSCPMWRSIGGQAYGSPYSGPIGAVLTPLLEGPTSPKAAARLVAESRGVVPPRGRTSST